MKKVIIFFLMFVLNFNVVDAQVYQINEFGDQFLEKIFTRAFVSQIINNTYSPLIITSPDIKNNDIFIEKNVSLLNQEESVPLRSQEYQNSLVIAPKTQSFIYNLKIPMIDASVGGNFDRKLRSNNYNPGTMSAIIFHVPPQKFQLNYSIVHKPLPVFALRQKGKYLDILEGEGLNSIYLNDQQILAPLFSSIMPFFEKIDENETYTIQVNQVKPIGHFESIRHNSEDLSTMYLDGGAWVAPLRLNPNTLDIVIYKNNKSEN